MKRCVATVTIGSAINYGLSEFRYIPPGSGTCPFAARVSLFESGAKPRLQASLGSYGTTSLAAFFVGPGLASSEASE